MNDYASKYAQMSDEELQMELIRVTNDSYLLYMAEEQEVADYRQRSGALRAELDSRKKEDNDEM